MKSLLLIGHSGLNGIKKANILYVMIRNLGNNDRNRIEHMTGVSTGIDVEIIHGSTIDRGKIGIGLINESKRIVVSNRGEGVLQILNDILRGILSKAQRQIDLGDSDSRIE